MLRYDMAALGLEKSPFVENPGSSVALFACVSAPQEARTDGELDVSPGTGVNVAI